MYQQQKSNTHPVVVQCPSGIGRSGLICLLTAAIFDVANNANCIPDLTVLAIKLSNYRKNILRDREHLKFGFESLLAYIRQVVSDSKLKLFCFIDIYLINLEKFYDIRIFIS